MDLRQVLTPHIHDRYVNDALHQRETNHGTFKAFWGMKPLKHAK